MEIKGIFIIELDLVVPIVECAHAVVGEQYWWWKPLPGNAPNFVTFKWSWEDFIISFDDEARDLFFDKDAKREFKAAFCMRLPETYAHKRRRNRLKQKAQYTELPDGEQHQHCVTVFAFVRDDGAIIFLEPQWNSNRVAAMWITDEVTTALAAANSIQSRAGRHLGQGHIQGCHQQAPISIKVHGSA